MSEEGRCRSTLSSSSTAFGNQFYSSTRNPCPTKDDSSRSYTETWIKNYNQQPRSNTQFCQEFSRREALIEKKPSIYRKAIRPCPVMSCTKHHESTKDVEMVETGQYDSVPSNSSDFKLVSPKISAKTRSIKTSNKYQDL
ncbi:hypothetical protein AVEN_204165-1 [Araneus ventricosus]|uniref:Uncharacterized protein n=1 Tax=Araneus ventricosus TaxID=182803 RepID=A0A4Y2NL68_ARAVE|nr:hypothetical protein AVEN_204165-1 [Araneus ventricosus]